MQGRILRNGGGIGLLPPKRRLQIASLEGEALKKRDRIIVDRFVLIYLFQNQFPVEGL